MTHKSLSRQGIPDPGHTPHPGSVWIDRNWDTLPNNEWVAANADGFVASDYSQDGLISKLRDKKIDVADVSIAYKTTDAL